MCDTTSQIKQQDNNNKTQYNCIQTTHNNNKVLVQNKNNNTDLTVKIHKHMRSSKKMLSFNEALI